MTHEVRAEMGATVVQLLVEPGTAVEAGDGLMMIESMKIEIPVVAEVSGVVSKLLVAKGNVVQEGDVIAVID